MIIGCPTEIKNQEYRVGITPAAAAEAILHGHKVLIQSGAGNGSGFTDNEYMDIPIIAKIAIAKMIFDVFIINKLYVVPTCYMIK